jgi:putative oxidoreductase
MAIWHTLHRWHDALARILDTLRSPLLLATRVWVAWQFLKSGWLKLTNWDTTILLFESEYRVPLMSPPLAAVAATAGELVFPLLIALGAFTRLGALGLFAVNAMAVVSYWHVIGGEGYEAAIGQHWLWGFMLLVLVAFGAGRVSVDGLGSRSGQ